MTRIDIDAFRVPAGKPVDLSDWPTRVEPGYESKKQLDHDILWRTTRSLPERGRIGIFNRSYYEEVLAVRVHREILDSVCPTRCSTTRRCGRAATARSRISRAISIVTGRES